MSNEWIKYEEKIVLGDNNTVLCILHLDGALVFGRAVIDELDVKYSSLDYKDKIEKCYDMALSRANENFLKPGRNPDKEFLHEQITCHGLYMNHLLNGFTNYTKSIIKML